MTDQTPVERASSYIISKSRKGARSCREYAQDAFDSIDTDQLATITQDAHAHWAHYEGDLDLWEYVAQAVKNWLTGKDQQ